MNRRLKGGEHYQTKRDQLERSPPFDRKTLQTVFVERVLPGTKRQRSIGRTPTDNALAQLASVLNHWHAYFYDVQERRKFNEAAEKARAGIDLLMEALPVLGERHKALADQGDQFSLWQFEAAGRLYVELARDPQRITHRDDIPDQVRGWQWLLDVLVEDFAAAWRSANDREPGIDGPLVRFWAAVIPYVTGEHPKESSIRRRLREREKDTSAAVGGQVGAQL